jgi:hypothetical protein
MHRFDDAVSTPEDAYTKESAFAETRTGPFWPMRVSARF